MLYAPDYVGLHVADANGGDAQSLDWERDVSDVVTAGAYRATLLRNAALGNVLELSRDGVVVSSLAVGPMAERLIADDARVLVLSLAPREQCEQTGSDCSDYAPNVAIVALADAPALTATVPLSDPDALGDGTQGEHQIAWGTEDDVAFALGQGRFVLVADYFATCTNTDACAALGVTANQTGVNTSTPDTPPCAPGASCSAPPLAAPAPAAVFGERHALRLYLLDASAAEPHLSAPVDSVLELADSRFGRTLVSDHTLLVTRIERETLRGAASGSQPARFMLDRFALENGALRAETPVNIPGFPVALSDDGALLFTVEPAAEQGAGTLHMLALDGAAAYPLDMQPLDPSYSDAIAAFDKIFYLRHDTTDCAGQSTLVPFRLPSDRDAKLRALPELRLPGGRYRIADAHAARLLLADGDGHYVVLDVSGDTPKLVKFLAAAVGLTRPRLQSNGVLGPAGPYPDELTFP